MTAVPSAVRAVVEQYRLARDLATHQRDDHVATACRDRSRTADGYWQQAHDAEQRYLTALIVASAFEAEP